jgi:hypothetical protein
LLTGILCLFIILFAVAVPAGHRFETGNFFEGYAADPAWMNFLWTVMAAVSMLSLAVVPPVSRRIGKDGNEWMEAAKLDSVLIITGGSNRESVHGI